MPLPEQQFLSKWGEIFGLCFPVDRGKGMSVDLAEDHDDLWLKRSNCYGNQHWQWHLQMGGPHHTGMQLKKRGQNWLVWSSWCCCWCWILEGAADCRAHTAVFFYSRQHLHQQSQDCLLALRPVWASRTGSPSIKTYNRNLTYLGLQSNVFLHESESALSKPTWSQFCIAKAKKTLMKSRIL